MPLETLSLSVATLATIIGGFIWLSKQLATLTEQIKQLSKQDEVQTKTADKNRDDIDDLRDRVIALESHMLPERISVTPTPRKRIRR